MTIEMIIKNAIVDKKITYWKKIEEIAPNEKYPIGLKRFHISFNEKETSEIDKRTSRILSVKCYKKDDFRLILENGDILKVLVDQGMSLSL